ncbi:MAG: glycosyltransferase [Actinomycetia bacterium]|nr:glycosyltransferase [Actinomycetes bacterium]
MVGTRLTRGLVRAGSLGALALTAHTAWNLTRLRVPAADPPEAAEPVSVLLPLRDEAHRVEPCLRAVLAQEHVPRLEVLVLDDGSTDGTADVVRGVVGSDPRVRLLVGGPDGPPAGWLGKPWACHRLAEAASGGALVYVDADVVLAPQAVAASVALLRAARLALLSPYPRQEVGTLAERLVQPLLQWSWLTTLPLGPAERSPRPSLAAANGQLLVVDAAAYRRAGGHAAVRGEVLDDVALLRAVKRAGARGVVADGTALASCRMYEGWADLSAGYTKSLWSAFGSPPRAAAVIGALVLLYVVPPVAALTGSPVGAAGYAAGVVGRALVARRVRGRVWPDSLAHPASVVLLGYLTAQSWRGRRRGTLRWKGRPVLAR